MSEEGDRFRRFVAGDALRLDDLIPHGVAHKLADGVQLQFAHNVGAVSFGGFALPFALLDQRPERTESACG